MPPPNWRPSRSERLASARDTLRRRFGSARLPRGRRPYALRHLTRVQPFLGGTTYVPASEIEADLREDITSINPPVLQGWAVVALVAAGFATFYGLGSFQRAGDLGSALLGIFGPTLAWIFLVATAGLGQSTIELRANGVYVRRWLQCWLGLQGRRLGAPDELEATLRTPSRLDVTGPQGSLALRLWSWPPSARADLIDELPIWGVNVDFGR